MDKVFMLATGMSFIGLICQFWYFWRHYIFGDSSSTSFGGSVISVSVRYNFLFFLGGWGQTKTVFWSSSKQPKTQPKRIVIFANLKFVMSRNTHFRVSWRLLVEERNPNIALQWQNFPKKGSFVFFPKQVWIDPPTYTRKELFTKYVSQCQHFPNPPPPFVSQCHHCPKPPPFAASVMSAYSIPPSPWMNIL